MVSPPQKGDECYYLTRGGEWVAATVLKVHYDDEVEIYFTISVDGAERQTVASKLRKVIDGEPPPPPPPPAADPPPPAAGPLPPSREYSAASTAALLKLAAHSADAAALFKKIDADGDGAITARELAAYFVSVDDEFAKRLFKAMDIDRDGLLDIDEFRVAHRWATETRAGMRMFFDAGPCDELFSRIDSDGDGAITRRDIETFLRETLHVPDPATDASRLFSAIDRDEDGLIDPAEFREAHRKARANPASGHANANNNA